jgi:uncharacterized damage-inducible protein DinB
MEVGTTTVAEDMKASLHSTLRRERTTNLSKLEGLSEYDLRRPLTPTGTNLLGVLKHLAGIEYGYLGETFGRTIPGPIPGDDDDLWNNGDMWARADESSEHLIDWYKKACGHADETVRLHDLGVPGEVPHWPGGKRATTLGAALTIVIGEESRHGGHIDVVRELIDGRADTYRDDFGDATKWREYVAKVQAAADVFVEKS